jgi:hypothetical protein
MHPLTKRIALLVSMFSLVIGLFLLGYNLHFISEEARSTALNLWPVLLVIAGIMLVFDSTKKRVSAHASRVEILQFPIPMPPASTELSFRVQFSYGRLVVGCAAGAPCLVTEQVGSGASPDITQQMLGDRTEISIAISQPIFPAHFQLRNTWRLDLPREIMLRLAVQLHEADLRMDLRRLEVETLDLRTDSGEQEVLLGKPRKKLSGQIYSSGSDLSLVLPARVFAWVRLLNPFCRVDYPQGDLEKREDGSLVTPTAGDAQGTVELAVDGPIHNLVLDVDDADFDSTTDAAT